MQLPINFCADTSKSALNALFRLKSSGTTETYIFWIYFR